MKHSSQHRQSHRYNQPKARRIRPFTIVGQLRTAYTFDHSDHQQTDIRPIFSQSTGRLITKQGEWEKTKEKSTKENRTTEKKTAAPSSFNAECRHFRLLQQLASTALEKQKKLKLKYLFLVNKRKRITPTEMDHCATRMLSAHNKHRISCRKKHSPKNFTAKKWINIGTRC